VAAAVELRPAHDVVAPLGVAADGDVLGKHRTPVGVVPGCSPQAPACMFT
jgi:hypothetical protein